MLGEVKHLIGLDDVYGLEILSFFLDGERPSEGRVGCYVYGGLFVCYQNRHHDNNFMLKRK